MFSSLTKISGHEFLRCHFFAASEEISLQLQKKSFIGLENEFFRYFSRFP